MKRYQDFFLLLKEGSTFISRDGYTVSADEDTWFFGDASANVCITDSTKEAYITLFDETHGSVVIYRDAEYHEDVSTEDLIEFVYECRRDFADIHVYLCESNLESDWNIKFWRACTYLITLINETGVDNETR